MDINAFKANYRFGGARTSLFRVYITNPIDGSADLKTPMLVKAASLPPSNITPIEVWHAGRNIKVAGKKSYEDWTVTVYNDEDFSIKDKLETWSNAINTPETNTRATGSSEISDYKSTAIVEQLSQTGRVIRTYKMIGIFPTAIAPIDLDWETENVQQYQVTFALDYFLVENGETGNGGPI